MIELRQDEKIKTVLRKHWFVFVPLLSLCLFLIILPIVALIIIKINNVNLGDYQILALLGFSVFLLLVLAFFINAFIDYYLDIGIITNFRIIDIEQQGLFNRSISEQNLIRVQDVTAKSRGIFQTFLDYGNVFIETAGEAPNFEFHAIAKPNHVAESILQLHHHAIGHKADDDSEDQDEHKLSGEIKF